MSAIPPLNQKEFAQQMAENLGTLLVQVAVHETGTLQTVWKRLLDDKSQVALFSEILVLLVAITDRFAFTKYGDPLRNIMMNAVVTFARNNVANQKHFGTTTPEREQHFERLFADRMGKYGSCSSIMGEGANTLVFTGGSLIAETFLKDIPEPQFQNVVFETCKVISTMLLASMKVEPIKTLLAKE